MTPDQENFFLREIAIAACERLGNGLVSGAPTAVRLSEDMNPDAVPPDVDIVAYTAFLADEELYEPLKENVDPGDVWLGEFTYDLEKPFLTKPAADEYRRLRNERERLRTEMKDVEREYALVVEVLRPGIDDRLDPSRLVDPDCLAVTRLLSDSKAKTRDEARRMLAGTPELDQATAKTERKTANRRKRTLSDRLERLRQTHIPKIQEIDQQLNHLCTAGVKGVLSPTASDLGLAAWAFIRVNKQLIKNESLHRRAQNQLIEACTPAEADVTKNAARQGKAVTKKRGGQKKTAQDIALYDDYMEGLERGSWPSMAAFARDRGMRPDTTRIALTRGKAAKAKLDAK